MSDLYLSKKHIRLLQDVAQRQIVRSNPRQLQDIEYLQNLGLLQTIRVDREDDFYCEPVLTEKGSAVLYERVRQNRRATVALVLSIISTVLSLTVALTPLDEWLTSLIMSLFQ